MFPFDSPENIRKALVFRGMKREHGNKKINLDDISTKPLQNLHIFSRALTTHRTVGEGRGSSFIPMMIYAI